MSNTCPNCQYPCPRDSADADRRQPVFNLLAAMQVTTLFLESWLGDTNPAATTAGLVSHVLSVILAVQG